MAVFRLFLSNALDCTFLAVMPRSVKFIRLFAVLALLAWSNVQAMACCLGLPEQVSIPEKAGAAEITAPMAEGHSCCPGEEGQGASENPASPHPCHEGCGTGSHAAMGLCGTHVYPAEQAASFASPFSFVQGALIVSLLPGLPGKPAQSSLPPPPLASGGPPRYLALERILI